MGRRAVSEAVKELKYTLKSRICVILDLRCDVNVGHRMQVLMQLLLQCMVQEFGATINNTTVQGANYHCHMQVLNGGLSACDASVLLEAPFTED